jgi:hypothetical protein
MVSFLQEDYEEILAGFFLGLDSSVSIIINWELDDQVSIPCSVRNFFLRHPVHTGCGVHQASYPMGIGGSEAFSPE